MAIQNQVVKNVYSGNGTNKIFYYTFELDTDKGDNVRVFVTDEEGFSVEVTDFSVNTNNKSITYPKTEEKPPITADQKITIFRVTPVEQTTNFENQGAYFAESVEHALDELTLMVQENREQIRRSVRVDPSEEADPQEVWRVTKKTMEEIVEAKETVEGDSAKLKEDIEVILAEAQAQADNAQASAETAATSEANAANSATIANTAATTATNAAQTATSAAQNAATSAATAATNATTAVTSAATTATQAITGLVNQAQTHANTAAQAAINAQSASTTAQTASATATTMATNAASSAAAAKVSEESADDAAQSAISASATAKAYGDNVQQLAEQASASVLSAAEDTLADITAKAAQAAQSAQDAQTAVETAAATLKNEVAADKQAAQDAAANASLYATAASTSATAASNSAASASVNASVASTAATTASEKATQVRADAETASAAALAAAQSETDAKAAVNEAYFNAQQAKVSADAAANSATEAANQAGRAGVYAGQAADSAEEAAESTVQAKRLAKATMDRIAVSSIGIPAQEGTLTYNGQEQSPTWDLFYESEKMVTSGVTSATDAGTYTAIITPAEGYYWWEDNTTEPKEITWTIKRQPLQATPSQVGTLIYNGDEQSPSWRDYSEAALTRGGDLTGVEEDRYTTTFTPTANYCWEDGSTVARPVEWRIFALVVDIPTVTETAKVYNREEQSPTISAFDNLVIQCTGDKGTDAGDYIVTLHLRSNSVTWSDGTRADRNTAWTIARKVVDIPVVSDTSKVYNSESQAPTISEYSEYEITMGGDTSKLHAGNYTLTMALTSTSNYVWSDETTGVKERTWNIARKSVDVPQVTSTDKIYSGDEQSPNILDYDEDAITVSGTTEATEPGTYTIYFSLVTGEDYADYIWSDETTGRKEATWSISKFEITIPSLTGTTSWIYDKTEHTPTISNPDSEYVDVTGDTSAENAGDYTITFSLKNTTTSVWSDDTTAPKTATWHITKKDIAIPSLTNTNKTYNRIEQFPTKNNVTADYVTVGGTTEATNAGNYTVTWTLVDTANTQWTDKTNGQKFDTWKISPKVVQIPTLTDNEQTYDGSELHPTISTFSTDEVAQTGVATATATDTYTVYWNLTSTSNYVWNDETTGQKSATWTINKRRVSVPTIVGQGTEDNPFIYNGSEQSPTWNIPAGVAINETAGTRSATKATQNGYYVFFYLSDENTIWDDETTGQKSATWYIDFVYGNLVFYVGDTAFADKIEGDARTFGTYTMLGTKKETPVATLTAKFVNDAGEVVPEAVVTLLPTKTPYVTVGGDYSVYGDNTSTRDLSLATVEPDEDTGGLLVTALKTEPFRVRVYVSLDKNYWPRNTKYSPPYFRFETAIKTLNDYTWDEISAISQAGLGEEYFAIGDCKEITLNGKIGDYYTANNEKLCVFIGGFNHVDNGVASNNILWLGFKTALKDGKDVALVESLYSPDAGWANYTDGKKHFTMNHAGNTNYGGWKGSDIRYDILGATSQQPSDYGKSHTTSCAGYDATEATLTSPKADTLLAALPSDLRKVIRLRTHYVDNEGNKSNVDANVTAVVDAISLLAEFEVQGARSYANQYEKNHQSQVKYYKDGNSKVRYKSSATGSAVYWWCCSPHYNSTEYFCNVNTDGRAVGGYVGNALGLAPAFIT